MESSTTKYYSDVFTSFEVEGIKKLRILLKENNINYDEDRFTDSFLVRTIRGRDNDINKAYEMFTNYLKYREENSLENILSYELPNIVEIKKYFPHFYHKTDKFGRPVYFEIIGNLNIENLWKITTSENMIKYYVQDYETLYRRTFPLCSEFFGRYIGQILMIIDLKNVSLSLLSSKVREFIKLKSNVDQTYYPEKIFKLFIINTSFMFKMIWGLVSVFVPERTKKKITTLGSNYTPQLLEVIDKENLPKFYGGVCECEEGCMNSNTGPWKYAPIDREYTKYT